MVPFRRICEMRLVEGEIYIMWEIICLLAAIIKTSIQNYASFHFKSLLHHKLSHNYDILLK